jgi:diguanylate cyclase (GGDEF)-like protein/PAS domain S-box-containing protein
MDRDGRYLNIWTQKQELLATSKTEMLGRTVHEVLSPQSATILMEAIRETEEHGLSTGKVICIELPQGTHWFEHTVSRKAGVGADARFLMLSHDVTERKLAERALQENFEQITALNQHLEITARNLEEQASELEQSKQQLQLTEAWYRGILHSAPDGMLVVNGHGIITLVNAELCRMFGYGDTELIGQTIELLVPNRARADHVAKRQDFIASHSKASRMAGEASNLRGRCKNGSEFAVDVALSRLPDLNGNEGAICAAIRDVTEQQRLEKALAARELESRTLIENTPDSISRHDRNGAYIFVNQALADSIKGGITTMLGKKPTEIRPTDLSEIFEEKLSQVFTTGTNTEFELTWLDKRGNDMCYHIRLTAEFDASGAVATVLAVGRDITELNAYRQKIHQMAFYDTLTSLPNRALFNDRLRQMLTDALWHEQRAGVLLLDLDRFKAINDTMGHPAGDALLREAAARLTGCVRGYDTVARLGGDEFAILLPDIRAGDDLGRIASKILAAFNEPFMLEGKEVFVSTSIGIAVYPNDSADADELVKQADSAMYFAKRSGRNGFRFYSKDLTASAGERLSLESELRRALERKELELYYQPKVQLSNNQLIGSEALLRWNNPQRGMVPPDQFISIAEDSGLILEIGEWVLHNACRTACDWNAIGKPLHKVAINLSARQFQSNDLVETVRHALDATGCQPEWIELEITESLLLDEQGEVLEMLESFRVMGISVAIDDFGTGYSSLSYLARFPINTLKIDRSFIRTVTTEHFRAELVRAILSIARCLGQEVVAEGVETPEQAVFLREHGCQIAQGYLFSKPVPKAEFEAMSFTSAFSDETHLSAR